MTPLLERTPDELRQWLAGRGLPGYRAGQIEKWLFQKRASSFDEMTVLPTALRMQLAGEFAIWTSRVAKHRTASDGSEKLLLELCDGQTVECVLLRDDKQHCAVCLSTQVGCAMGCTFCATGIDGFVRNLTRGEIIEEMLHLQRLLGSDERLSHVVVMGMGEPLLNLDAVLLALEMAVSSTGLGISVRRVTISTVGLSQGIRRLAREGCPYHLAVSLHAPNDSLRNELVPANRGTGLSAILEATDEYFELTGRRVTFEYVLLAGVNDSPQQAEQLVHLLRGRPALINLIPFNPVPGLRYRTPSSGATAKFVDVATRGGLNINIRHRKGDRIGAACGQLRRASTAVETNACRAD